MMLGKVAILLFGIAVTVGLFQWRPTIDFYAFFGGAIWGVIILVLLSEERV